MRGGGGKEGKDEGVFNLEAEAKKETVEASGVREERDTISHKTM